MIGIYNFIEELIVMKCIVKMIWHDESCRWHCESEEVPGFLLESSSFDTLVERVKIGLPDYLEVDLGYKGDLQIVFESHRIENMRVAV